LHNYFRDKNTMANLTINDIARMANVSKTAVSFVLNGKEGVGEETRNRVLAVIEQTNYSPNVHTRRLNLKKSFTIYVVMHQQEVSFANLFNMEIIFGILNKSKELGYSVVFISISDEKDIGILSGYVRNKDTDGIIFMQDPENSILSIVEDSSIPFLVVDSHAPDTVSYTQVKVDYFIAAYEAVKYLIEKGHKKVAFIGMESQPDYYVNTFGGFNKALQEANLPIMPTWIQSEAKNEQSAYNCMQRIIDAHDLPTAVFCAGDIFAISAMKCVKENNLLVPGNISFVGLDDIVVSPYVDPPLTTMSINENQMGEESMQIIFDMINNNSYQNINYTSSNIVERSTVKDLT